MESKNYTLGTNIIPYNYELFFEPNFSDFKYKGEEKIYLKIKKPTKSISINSSELEILTVSVTSRKKTQSLNSSTYDNKNERLTFYFEKAISGDVLLEIKFTGTHNDKMVGFYRSKYVEDGIEKYFMTTQFEAADARRAFPCFDEPSFKATFELSLLIDENLTAISNMPSLSEEKIKNKKLIKFKRTPKMSTYLLYMGVGNLEITSDKLDKLVIRLITTPGKKIYAKLPISYAKKFISFYEKYFGVKYPLPKLDLIAVPDFAAGAMENWGAITFRETALLGDEKSAVISKQRIAEVIAHELTHQWFGDLVTMAWWEDLWLNESFATFMSYKAMDFVFPDWEIELQYISEVISTAFAADQLLSTHPINVKVNSPDEIDQIFDEISYDKGGSILNMLEDYVGKEVFRKGLNLYLNEYSYSNATKQNLWDKIAEAARKNNIKTDISKVAKAWIEKEGHPYISVSRSKNGFLLSQERFILLNKKSKSDIWPIPIRYYLSHNGKNKHLFVMDKKTAEIKTSNASSFIKLNSNQKGFYRVFYPKEMLSEIGELIKEQELSQEEAWGVENDLYYFTKKGMYKVEEYLEFVNSYCFAAKYPLNVNVLKHLNGLYNLLFNTKSSKKEDVRLLLKDYSSEILKQVGWVRSKNESNTITILRSSAISSSGVAGDISTINKAKKMFNNFISNKKELDSNLKTVVYKIVASYGSKTVFNEFVKRYEKEDNPTEKIRYLQTLGFFKDIKILRNALDFSMSKKVRFQDSFMIPAMCSSNPSATKLLFSWTISNWKVLLKQYPSGTHMLSRYVDNLGAITDKKLYSDFKSFFSKSINARGDTTTSIKQSKEIIEINLNFIEKATRR